jgi:hypothetical protein
MLDNLFLKHTENKLNFKKNISHKNYINALNNTVLIKFPLAIYYISN